MWKNQGCEELLHQMEEKLVEFLNIWLMDSDHMSDVENHVFGILGTKEMIVRGKCERIYFGYNYSVTWKIKEQSQWLPRILSFPRIRTAGLPHIRVKLIGSESSHRPLATRGWRSISWKRILSHNFIYLNSMRAGRIQNLDPILWSSKCYLPTVQWDWTSVITSTCLLHKENIISIAHRRIV